MCQPLCASSSAFSELAPHTHNMFVRVIHHAIAHVSLIRLYGWCCSRPRRAPHGLSAPTEEAAGTLRAAWLLQAARGATAAAAAPGATAAKTIARAAAAAPPPLALPSSRREGQARGDDVQWQGHVAEAGVAGSASVDMGGRAQLGGS